MNYINRMKELIKILNQANHEYYNLNSSIYADEEYDNLYDELLELEHHAGIILSNSPTINVGYEVVSKLEKVQHNIALLSLNKTKETSELRKFIGDKYCVLMLKLDGLTTKTEYNKELKRGSSRGNGQIGEDITHNVMTFKNIPIHIHKESTVIGESIITYDDFEEINSQLPVEEKYKNPRNLASGSVRQLDGNICAKRNVKFIAYGMQKSNHDTKVEQLKELEELGFEVVPYVLVNKDNFESAIDMLRKLASDRGYPIDGLVCTYNDIKYGESLGSTSKFPHHSLAFKFGDELHETKFLGIEANTTRTGMISLTGIFESVEIDGTEVSRASLHNVDIFESLQLGKGDTILVRKANMIIPQVMDNLTRSNTTQLPTECPDCGSKAEIRSTKEARFLYCTNDNCSAKLVQKISHFVSRDCMNIVGLSEATIEKFVDLKLIHSPVDLYYLDQCRSEIINLDGFGKKSYDKLRESIINSLNVDFANFINALGIPNVGKTTAKVLAKHFDETTFSLAISSELISIQDIGEVVANSITEWFNNVHNTNLYYELLDVGFNFKKQQEVKESSISGKTFVVTGSVEKFSNRKELSKKIEELGGKVSGSVSAKTDYLINNDTESNSSKNVAAKKLNIPIISEEQFIEMIGGI